jgi:hypothetical protein
MMALSSKSKRGLVKGNQRLSFLFRLQRLQRFSRLRNGLPHCGQEYVERSCDIVGAYIVKLRDI